MNSLEKIREALERRKSAPGDYPEDDHAAACKALDEIEEALEQMKPFPSRKEFNKARYENFSDSEIDPGYILEVSAWAYDFLTQHAAPTPKHVVEKEWHIDDIYEEFKKWTGPYDSEPGEWDAFKEGFVTALREQKKVRGGT